MGVVLPIRASGLRGWWCPWCTWSRSGTRRAGPLTTTMEHRGGQDNDDGALPWLGRPGTGLGLVTGDARGPGEVGEARSAAARPPAKPGYQPPGSARRASPGPRQGCSPRQSRT